MAKTKMVWPPHRDHYYGLTRLRWANRIVDYNPGKFDKSALISHYTAQQLGKFQEGGNTQLTKALKGKSIAPTKAKTTKKSADEDAVKYIKTIKKTPSAPCRSGKALEVEKLLRQIASENGIAINFDRRPDPAPKKPAPKKPAPKNPADLVSDDDSDLESCSDED